MDNKRKHTRVALKREVEISASPSGTIPGSSINISFYGMMVQLSGEINLHIGDRCRLNLVLQKDERVSIGFECEIVHLDGNIVGVKFISIEGLDGYERFRNLIVYNSPESDKLLEELQNNPGIDQVNISHNRE